jgi:hypothetical protein
MDKYRLKTGNFVKGDVLLSTGSVSFQIAKTENTNISPVASRRN